MQDADADVRDGLPVLTFEERSAFENWLSVRGPTSKGIWLRLAKKGARHASLTKADAIDAALCHGWIDGQLQKYDAVSWIVRFTPRQRASRWSAVNRARALELLAAGRVAPAGIAAIEAAQADGPWMAAYAPASRAEVPADLQAALDQAPKAAAFFATLNGANRYAILYRLGAVKRPETRARRIAEFVAMLARGETIHGRKPA